MIKQITSPQAIIELGSQLGRKLKGGETIELIGDVGAGKTTFTKGLAEALGISEKIQSPSFTISRFYQGSNINLAHYDFYRLINPGIMADELAEAINDQQTIVVVEWGQTIADILPKNRLKVEIHLSPEGFRNVKIEGIDDFIS